jgi:hypothetical protein
MTVLPVNGNTVYRIPIPTWHPIVCFWAEKLILVIIHQFLPREAKISINKLHVSSIQLSIARFSGQPPHFTRPRFPMDRFSIVKKHFFINTITMSKVLSWNIAGPTVFCSILSMVCKIQRF